MKTVYLVEDSSLLRAQLSQALDEVPGVVVAGWAATVTAALSDIQGLRPHILVVDLQLSEGSGWDVVDQAGHPIARTIILTNHSSPPFRAAAAQRGIHLFFDKTHEFEQFVQSLQELT